MFVAGAKDSSTKDEVSVAIESFTPVELPNTEVGRNAKDAFCSDDVFSLKKLNIVIHYQAYLFGIVSENTARLEGEPSSSWSSNSSER